MKKLRVGVIGLGVGYFHIKGHMSHPMAEVVAGSDMDPKRLEERGKVKIPESIKGKKEVQENLNLAYDSVKIENEKEEVLECQPVTTS
ncbi:hypothetical protein B9J78_02070 [bacterium Unc6]|nr:hypothetical protein [bacterium Unc6]